LKRDFLEQLDIDENHEMECKLAEGGLPDSIWETLNLEVGQVVYILGATDLRNTPQSTTQTTQTTTQTTQTFQDTTQTNSIQKQILDLVKYNGELSQKEIADEIGENYNTVKYHIQQMKKKGIIERIGTSHKGHWNVRG
jgi:predicted HTH transcriptional regulator